MARDSLGQRRAASDGGDKNGRVPGSRACVLLKGRPGAPGRSAQQRRSPHPRIGMAAGRRDYAGSAGRVLYD